MKEPYGRNEGDIWSGGSEELELQLDSINLRLIHEIIDGEEKVYSTRDPDLVRKAAWGTSILGTLLCPRCERNRFTPYSDGVSLYEGMGAPPPALSRIDNVTYVCSDCGRDEAMRQLNGEAPILQEEWPLLRQGQYGVGVSHT